MPSKISQDYVQKLSRNEQLNNEVALACHRVGLHDWLTFLQTVLSSAPASEDLLFFEVSKLICAQYNDSSNKILVKQVNADQFSLVIAHTENLRL